MFMKIPLQGLTSATADHLKASDFAIADDESRKESIHLDDGQ